MSSLKDTLSGSMLPKNFNVVPVCVLHWPLRRKKDICNTGTTLEPVGSVHKCSLHAALGSAWHTYKTGCIFSWRQAFAKGLRLTRTSKVPISRRVVTKTVQIPDYSGITSQKP